MNRAYVIETNDGGVWRPVCILLAIPREIQALMSTFADQQPYVNQVTRWRRLQQNEAIAIAEAGCEVRAKDFDAEIDWS